MLDAGGDLAGYWTEGEPKPAAGFVERFAQARRAADWQMLLDDADTQLVLIACRPDSRARLASLYPGRLVHRRRAAPLGRRAAVHCWHRRQHRVTQVRRRRRARRHRSPVPRQWHALRTHRLPRRRPALFTQHPERCQAAHRNRLFTSAYLQGLRVVDESASDGGEARPSGLTPSATHRIQRRPPSTACVDPSMEMLRQARVRHRHRHGLHCRTEAGVALRAMSAQGCRSQGQPRGTFVVRHTAEGTARPRSRSSARRVLRR